VYERHWADRTRPYDGVPELLEALAGRKLKLAVLSNKLDAFTVRMTAHFFPDVPFLEVRGSRPGVPRKPDPFSAMEIADSLKVPPAEFLYLGDTAIDMARQGPGHVPVGVAWASAAFRVARPERRSDSDPLDLLPALT
jgi:phosphoglycolate phosphatase